MREYQIRNAELDGIFISFPDHRKWEAMEYYDANVKTAGKNSVMHGAKLVLAEWESQDEADKARLDWLEMNCITRRDLLDGTLHFTHCRLQQEAGHGKYGDDSRNLRAAIDEARGAVPQTKVTIIKTVK